MVLLPPREAGAKLATAARYHPEKVPAARQDLAAANIAKVINAESLRLREHGLWLSPEHIGALFLQLQGGAW